MPYKIDPEVLATVAKEVVRLIGSLGTDDPNAPATLDVELEP